MNMRKFVCLYLNTGGGHKSSANVLKQVLERKYPDASVELLNGFDQKNYLARFFFEKCYQLSCNYVPGAWGLTYDLGMLFWVQRIITMIIAPHTAWYLKKIIKKSQATDVVSFHFALTPSAVTAIRRLGGRLPFTVVVTDPFTVPTAWFYEKNVKYLVFSQRAKDGAVKNCRIPEQNIQVVPFLLNPKFLQPLTHSDEAALRLKHNIPEGKKVVLLAGGGEGLPNAVVIVRHLLKRKADFTILVVCGKDIAAKKMLDVMAQLHPHADLRPMGFISYMDEMVKICDCAVIKAGPATLMEVLVSKKPVIISSYIHGQELGNVQFAVRNNVGWFIRKPEKICNAVCRLLGDGAYLRTVKQKLGTLPISTDVSAVADCIYNRTM